MMTLIGLCAATALAFASGANDISKSIATLVGSGESDYKKAVIVTSLAAAGEPAVAVTRDRRAVGLHAWRYFIS